jgi:hypothetical protein
LRGNVIPLFLADAPIFQIKYTLKKIVSKELITGR